MIDIHSHILPGVDDGARDLHESLDMARIAVADGITHMFATPHHRDYGPLPRTLVGEMVASLQAAIRRAGLPLTVLRGHEVRLHDDVMDDWASRLAGPLGDGPYVLAEPPFDRYDRCTECTLFRLMEWGYKPIMAHPERILPIQDDLSLLEPFLERGGLTQVTATSMLGRGTGRDRDVAETMLRNDMVHFLASDAHGTFYRPPVLSAARDRAAEIVGWDRANRMVNGAPMSILTAAAMTA